MIIHSQARDFDPDSLRNGLPKAVSSLEWAVSEGKGKVYVHCTAGLGRAPAVAIAYMFWFSNKDVRRLPCLPSSLVFLHHTIFLIGEN